MRNLRGKWGLITGAASGIGHALTLALAREGMNLYLVDLNAERLESIANFAREAEVEVKTRVIDLRSTEQIRELTDRLYAEGPAIDLLVNNAGVLHCGPTEEMGQAELDNVLAVNFLAPLRLTRSLLPMLLARPEAHLVNVSSMYGYMVAPETAAYHASKFGLLGFSESLAVEYRGTSLGVTTVCPGFVRTSLFATNITPTGGGVLRYPPRWAYIKADHVAAAIVRGIRRKRRFVIVSWLAHLAYYAQRLMPGFSYTLQRFGFWEWLGIR